MKRLALLSLPLLGLLAACADDRTVVAPDVEPQFLLSGSGTITDAWDGGPLHGAIFTTTPFGVAVNANVQYTRKIEVYLDGGPRNPNSLAAGLNDGLYVFQITDPSGKYLLSEDPARCRVVQVAGGVIVNGGSATNRGTVPAPRIPSLPLANGSSLTDNWSDKAGDGRACHIESSEADGASLAGRHDTNADTDGGGGATVQMMPFGTTPNNGGVYKAWITPLAVYVQKAGGIAALNVIPADLKGKAGAACPDFCALPDLGFKNPSRNNVKTDNFKVKENPPLIVIKKYVDGVETPGWWVSVYEPAEGGDFTSKGWLETPATFAVPFGTEVLACERLVAGYKFVSATVDGVTVDPVASPPAPATDEEGNPILCVTVPGIATSTTVAVAFNNHKIVPNAKIEIEADGVNEIGKSHTFKATASVDPDETGWKPAADGTVISFSSTGSGTFDPASKTCTTSGGTGSCTIKLTSSNVGTDVVTATVTVIGLTRSTDGVAPNSGPATKYWVNAYITITPDGLNPIGEEHTFDVALTALPGDATPVTFNSITFQLTSATLTNPTDYQVVSETCSDKTKWGSSTNPERRTCKIVINSNKAGTIKATAKGSVTMGANQDPAGLGATVVRETDGLAQNSGPATKIYYKPAGCTPGFWKQDQHFGYWHDSPYSPVNPKTKVVVAFSHFTGQGGQTDGYDANLTLIDALGLDNSNGIGQVLRHGTAALLNAYSKGVLYGFGDDPQAVKNLVNAALDAYDAGNQTFVDQAHAKLAGYNELGCTLSGQQFWE
jgi:hypothetical protein